MDLDLTKLYYTIGEVAEMLGENTSLIRFWSNKFDGIIKPKKNKKGNRQFTPEDIRTFRIIHHLVKEKGMTLDGARKRLEDNREGEDRNIEVLASLGEIRKMLLEIQEMI